MTMDRNLVFRDEQERKKAFRILESPKAQNFLDGYSQYQTCYVAVRQSSVLPEDFTRFEGTN